MRKKRSYPKIQLFAPKVPIIPSYNRRCLTKDPRYKIELIPGAPDVEYVFNLYSLHDHQIRQSLYNSMWTHFKDMLDNNIHNRVLAVSNVNTVAYDQYVRKCLDHDCRGCGEHYGMRFIITTREQIENVLFVSITKYRRVYRREIPGIEEFSAKLAECETVFF